MSEQALKPIRHFKTDQYGAVDFEGQHVPCAFGGEPGKLTAFILIQGVCQIMDIPAEAEVSRIQNHHLLEDGLFMVSFPIINAAGKAVRADYPVITLNRLHTWLAMIPPEIVSSPEMRQKLKVTQQEFADVVYAYFGRRLLPAEIRAEDDPYIDKDRKKLYDLLEEASRFGDRLSHSEDNIRNLTDKVDRLIIAISAGEGGENIAADQQEQLKAMIDMLATRYEEKRGKGTRGEMINDLKTQHNFRFYNAVAKKEWPELVHDCVARFRALNPKGTALPRVFQLALDSIEQDKLF
jgi:hypothetical protein